MRYLIIPGIITAFSFAVIWAAFRLELSPAMIVGDSMQPRVFPIFLMMINLVLVACLVIQLRATPTEKVTLEGIRTWGSIGLFVVFYMLTVHVDMLVAIAVVIFAMCLLWGEQRLYVAGVMALATPGVIFILFDTLLRVRFPRGLLTNWYYG